MFRNRAFEVIKMKCKRVQKLLVSYRDGELPEDVRRSVSEHLATCKECGRYATEVEKVMAWAGTWGERQPSPHFLVKLKARIRGDEKPARARPTLGLLRPQRALVSIAAAFLVFFGGYLVGVKFVPRGGEGPVVARAEQDNSRLITGIQRIKMLFGGKLSETARSQLDEVQRVLAVRDSSHGDSPAVVDQLQQAEALVGEKKLAEARRILTTIDEKHPDHPLAPYVRMTLASTSEERGGYGAELLKNFYAMMVQDTVINPKEFYVEASRFPAQATEYGWQKIVESADRLNPLNLGDYIETRFAGGGGEL